MKKKDWDEYWQESARHKGMFAKLARLYRKYVISRAMRFYFHKYFDDSDGRIYLHAGCGSAESDSRIEFDRAKFIMVDLSVQALELAHRRSGYDETGTYYVCADIFNLPFKDESVDGLWNLGVMEHFYPDKVNEIAREFGRITKDDSRIMLFWPPAYGLTVLGLGLIQKIANGIFRRNIQFFPDEVNYFYTKKRANRMLHGSSLVIENVHFSVRDLFTYSVAVGKNYNDRAGIEN